MKNIYKIFICLLCLTCFIGLVGCIKSPSIVSIQINETTVPSEISIFDFDYTNLEIIIKYSDDTEKNLALEEYMFSTEDIAKFSRVGNHTITVNYEGKTTNFNIKLIEEAPESDNPQDINYNAVVYSTTTLDNNVIKFDINITGKGQFSGFQFALKYDTSKVTISSIVKNQGLSGVFEYVNNEGVITCNYTQNENQTADTYYFTIYFTADKMYNNFTQDGTVTFMRIIGNDVFTFNSYYFLLNR